MFGIGVPELIIILVLTLIVFGPGKLPDIGKAVGKTIVEFKKASREIAEQAITSTNDDVGSKEG